MKVSENGLNLIKQFEGLRLRAYLDAVNIPTIGYGATFYPGGEKVKMGDAISLAVANKLLEFHVNLFAKGVEKLLPTVSQNQFDALVSFAYNVGLGALQNSTLLKRIKENRYHPDISKQFAQWNKAGGRELTGLTKRRQLEADLYYTV